jgi:polar amino acid transport system substrate-binding protein
MLLSCLLVFGVLHEKVEAGCLKVLTEDYAPFNYVEQGKLTGFSVKIVEHLIKTTGVCIERDKILFWPWKRAYQAALNEPNVMLFTTTRNPDRENLFKWVGPIYPREQWLFKLKARKDILITSLEDAKKYKTVATNNAANYEFLIKNGFEPGQNLITTNFADSKIKMFLSGRADIAFFMPIEIAFQLKKRKSLQMVERIDVGQGKLYYYLAFNIKTPGEIISKFQNAFDAMKTDGTYETILNEYMNQ